MAMPSSNRSQVDQRASPLSEYVDSASTLRPNEPTYVTDEALKEVEPKPEIEDAQCDLEAQVSNPEGVVGFSSMSK